jgi:hypothetical protein
VLHGTVLGTLLELDALLLELVAGSLNVIYRNSNVTESFARF